MKKSIAWISLIAGILIFSLTIILSIYQLIKNSEMLVWLILSFLFVSIGHAQLASPNDSGVTFGHVHLNVSDIEEHKQIWVDHFNGTIVEKGSHSVIKLPNMLITLTQQKPTMDSIETAMHHFGFKVRRMDKFLDKWRADGLQVGSMF